MLDTCTLAVLGEMNSSAAICWLLRPAATSRSTSSSRAVSPNGATGPAWPVAAGRSTRARRASRVICRSSGWAPSRAERRQILGEALLNHFQSLVPAARRGQRLGQVRRDRRRHIPGQAELAGPGKIGPPGLDRGLVQAAGLQRVGDLHPGQQLQRPGPDSLRKCRRLLQVRDNFAASLPAHVGQPDLRLDPERFVTELARQILQLPSKHPRLVIPVLQP